MKTFQPTAPRGGHYAVSYLSHVYGPNVTQHQTGQFERLADAAEAARKIDQRLQPTIVLVKKGGEA